MPMRFGFVLLALFAFLLAACGDATGTATPGSAISTYARTVTVGAATASVAASPVNGGIPIGKATMLPNINPGPTMRATTLDAMTAGLENLSGQDFEITFMQDMIAHHVGAVEMAQLVPAHTSRPELVQLSKDIILAQNLEISQMTGWLAQWYNAKPFADPMNAPGMMAMMNGMDQLKTAKDAAFDKLFIQMMIPHHLDAVAMAQLVPTKATHAELKILAQGIVTSQTQEISEMQNWQTAGFKR